MMRVEPRRIIPRVLNGSANVRFLSAPRFALANDAYTLATLQGDANRLADAKRLFEGVADMAPNSYAGMNILAEVYIKTGRPGAALKQLERSLSITRESEFSSQATVLRGQAYRAIGQPQRAVDILPDEIIERYSDGRYSIRGEAYYIRGASNFALRQFFRAIADLTAAIHVDPNHIQAYNDRGQAYARLGQFELAIADFNQVVRLDPRFASGYNKQGFAGREFKELRKSIDGLDQAIKLDPEFGLAYFYRVSAITRGSSYSSHAIVLHGEAYRSLGQPQRAVENLPDEVIERYPNRGEAYYIRGASYFALGQFFRTIADLTAAIHADPKRILAYNDRGQAYARSGQFEPAIADLKQLVRLEPRFASGYNNKSFTDQEFEELRKSIDDLEQAINLDPELGSAYFYRALAITKGVSHTSHAMRRFLGFKSWLDCQGRLTASSVSLEGTDGSPGVPRRMDHLASRMTKWIRPYDIRRWPIPQGRLSMPGCLSINAGYTHLQIHPLETPNRSTTSDMVPSLPFRGPRTTSTSVVLSI